MENKKRFNSKIIISIVVGAILLGFSFWGCFTLGEMHGANDKYGSGEKLDQLLWLKEKVQSEYYYGATDDEFYGAAIDGINAFLLDDYSSFLDEQDLQSYVSSSKGKNLGIGVSFANTQDMRITNVIYNSPAERAGLKAGMYIRGAGASASNLTYITATPTSDLFTQFSAEITKFGAGEQFIIATSITPDGEMTNFTVSREYYTQSYVSFATKTNSYAFRSDSYDTETTTSLITLRESAGGIAELEANSMYIHLAEFNGDASKQFGQAMDKYKELGCTKLILDLRNNGGGSLSILQKICSYLLKDAEGNNPIVAVADFGEGNTTNFAATGNMYDNYLAGSTVKVLANANSASASEALLGALLDYNTIEYNDIYLSKIDGVAKTYGKGIMQTTEQRLGQNYGVKLTTAEIKWPVSLHSIHGVGIRETDGCIPVVTDDIADYNNVELKAVLNLIAGV